LQLKNLSAEIKIETLFNEHHETTYSDITFVISGGTATPAALAEHRHRAIGWLQHGYHPALGYRLGGSFGSV
jgi:hypothetical protein